MLFATPKDVRKNAAPVFHHPDIEQQNEIQEKSCTAVYFDQVRHIASLSRRAA